MNTVIQHIEYLTRKHDCVVVPGLGAFIAQYQSASVSDDGEMLFPPSRMLVFNGALTHNDGLLVSSVMRKDRVHYDEAVSIVKQSVSSLKCQLDMDGEVSLATVGCLRKKPEENTVEFIPGNDVSINSEFMNLVPLPVKPLVQNESAVSEETNGYYTATVALSPVRNIFRIAASIAVLLALSLCLTTPISVKDVSLASMSGASAGVSQDLPRLLTVDVNDSNISLARLPLNFGTEQVDTAAHNAYRRSFSDNYFVIVASLPDEATAAKYLTAMHDENLRMLKSDGRYRIYAASASTKQEAISIVSSETFLMKYQNAWVYRKR